MSMKPVCDWCGDDKNADSTRSVCMTKNGVSLELRVSVIESETGDDWVEHELCVPCTLLLLDKLSAALKALK